MVGADKLLERLAGRGEANKALTQKVKRVVVRFGPVSSLRLDAQGTLTWQVSEDVKNPSDFAFYALVNELAK